MSPPAPGRIVWFTVADPRGGNPKRRPGVVVSAPAGGSVLVAAVTTDIGRARSSETVELPSDPSGHPVTKLKRPSEVVCTWVTPVPVADLADAGGAVPPDLLAEIEEKVERFN
jgi:mRNA-degrading endonuclease toxin of MazEF toxin-antitoxin module